MRHTRSRVATVGIAMVCSAVLGLPITGGAHGLLREGSPPEPATSKVISLTPQEAQAEDLQDMAAYLRIPVDEVAARVATDEAFSQLTAQTRQRWPDYIAGAQVDYQQPDMGLELWMTSSTPESVRGEVESEYKALSARVTFEAPTSEGTLLDAQELVAGELSPALDHPYSIDLSPRLGTLIIRIGEGSESDVARATELAQGVLAKTPIGVEASTTDGRFELQTAIGGRVIRADDHPTAVPWCTTGFVVTNSDDQRRISTAGHCSSDPPEPLDYRDEDLSSWIDMPRTALHKGIWGDMAMHNSQTVKEASFHSNFDTVQEVKSVKQGANMNPGQMVCVFGRGGGRHCPLEVDGVNTVCDFDGDGSLDAFRLVRLTTGPTLGGDSGAPWFNVNEAWGIHTGLCGGDSVFTKAVNFDEGTGFHVMLHP